MLLFYFYLNIMLCRRESYFPEIPRNVFYLCYFMYLFPLIFVDHLRVVQMLNARKNVFGPRRKSRVSPFTRQYRLPKAVFDTVENRPRATNNV